MEPAYNIEQIGKGMICVKVKIPNRKMALHPRIRVFTEQVLDFLKAEGYNEYNIIERAPTHPLNNCDSEKALQGEWVFRKPQIIDSRLTGIDYSASKEIIEKSTPNRRSKTRKTNTNRSSKN